METVFKELDVRPILAQGGEPLQAILAAVDDLDPGEGLALFAPFRPQPLFSVMKRRGFDYEVSELEGGDFQVRFRPVANKIVMSQDVVDEDDWPEPTRAFDLSDLDPPQPMVKILSELETMSEGEVLFAVLAREPLFLFPELSKRGHKWAGNYDKDEQAFRLMVKRGAECHG